MAEPQQKPLPELVAELLDLVARFARQQAQETVQGYVIRPLKFAGAYVGAGCLSSVLASIGVIFLAVGLFLGLAKLLGSYWAAFLLVGGVYLVLAIVIIAARVFVKPEGGTDG